MAIACSCRRQVLSGAVPAGVYGSAGEAAAGFDRLSSVRVEVEHGNSTLLIS
jgi:hypothetical protein